MPPNPDDTLTMTSPDGSSSSMTFGDLERVTESMRRRDDQLARLAKLMDIADLPLFRPLAGLDELTPASAVRVLADGVYTSRRTASKLKLENKQFAWLDPETGHPVSGKLVVSYAPGEARIRPASLKLASLVFRNRKASAPDIASVVFQMLRELLKPEALDVAVVPAASSTDVVEVGRVTWKVGEARVYDPLEELVRLTLSIEVPRAIEHVRERGGVDKADVAVATKFIREIVAERKWETVNGHQSQELLDNLVRATAIAAMNKGGVGLFGLTFDAGTEAPDAPKPEQTDFVVWADGVARPAEG